MPATLPPPVHSTSGPTTSARSTWARSRPVRRAVAVAGGGSAALLAGAFAFQAAGYAPCQLCIWQRWPHAVAAAAALAVLSTGRRALIWAGALAAAMAALLALYHTGVEQTWWQGPAACAGGAGLAQMSVADLMKQIESAPLVRCTEIAWSLWGISMAGWNALISAGLLGLWLWAALRRGGRDGTTPRGTA